MLTKVTLDGPMGKLFGREWAFEINSPQEALKMVNVNRPGLFAWIKNNLPKYDKYRVTVEYASGVTEELETSNYGIERRQLKSVRFTPLVEGAGNIVRIVIGIVLIAASFIGGGNPFLLKMGWSMVISGVIGLLTPIPKKEQQSTNEDKTSYYFNGPVNTEQQGVPVQVIYGTVLVGSHIISAKISVDQLLGSGQT
jgi:predicted phage tail protein